MSHRPKHMKDTVGRERNNSCPCGSGLKYKKCCGRVLFARKVKTLPQPVRKPGRKTKSEIIASSLWGMLEFNKKMGRMGLRGR